MVSLFCGLRRPSDTVFVCLPRDLRGVAVLALSRSSHGHISFGDGYSVVGWLSPSSGEGSGCTCGTLPLASKFSGMFWKVPGKIFLSQVVDHGSGNKLRLGEKFSCDRHFSIYPLTK